MNNTTEETRAEPQLGYAVAFGSIMSIGFTLNATAIGILLRHHSLKYPSVIFMLNLAISDLLVASSFPLKVYFYATGTWTLGHPGCIGANLCFMVNILSSAIFITFICVDRLLAVVYPLRSRHIRTARNAIKAAALVWVFVIVIAIPLSVTFANALKRHSESFCFERPQHQHSHKNSNIGYVAGIVSLILILVLLIVNVVSTVLVSLTLRRNRKDFPKVNNKINVMLLFVMNLIMFTVCFLPMTIGLLLEGRQTYLQCISAANCCLDPVLYYFSLDAFWKKKEERNQLQLKTQDVILRH